MIGKLKHTFNFTDSTGFKHKKTFEYELGTIDLIEEHNKWIKSLRTVYICQDKKNLLIYGCFDSEEKAIKYANGSTNIAITPLTVS